MLSQELELENMRGQKVSKVLRASPKSNDVHTMLHMETNQLLSLVQLPTVQNENMMQTIRLSTETTAARIKVLDEGQSALWRLHHSAMKLLSACLDDIKISGQNDIVNGSDDRWTEQNVVPDRMEVLQTADAVLLVQYIAERVTRFRHNLMSCKSVLKTFNLTCGETVTIEPLSTINVGMIIPSTTAKYVRSSAEVRRSRHGILPTLSSSGLSKLRRQRGLLMIQSSICPNEYRQGIGIISKTTQAALKRISGIHSDICRKFDCTHLHSPPPRRLDYATTHADPPLISERNSRQSYGVNLGV
jgi:hypothetical protein